MNRVRNGEGRKPQVTKRLRTEVDYLQRTGQCSEGVARWLADYLAYHDRQEPARLKNREDTRRRRGGSA